MTHPDTTSVRYDPLFGPPRRVTFEPRDDGGWLRSEAVWNGRIWRTTGSEVVESVAVVQPKSPTP